MYPCLFLTRLPLISINNYWRCHFVVRKSLTKDCGQAKVHAVSFLIYRVLYVCMFLGMRPLTYAAWQGLIEPVNILLQSGASPNEPSREGETPLHFSCQHGHVDVVCLWWYQKKAWLQCCGSAVHEIQFLSHCNAYTNKMCFFLEGVWKTDLGRAHLICPAMFVFVRVICPSFSCQIDKHVHLSGGREETFLCCYRTF